NRIDPAAAKILGVLPAPNSPGSFDATNGFNVNNLVAVGSSKPSNNTITTRIDENFTSNDRFFGTLTHYKINSPIQPRIPGPLENNVGPGTTTGYQVTVGYTRTWTPTFV